jgi:hypothetical protein
MSFRIAEILALTLACSLFAPAQQGKAESGFYTWNYHGDTWTGTISSFDQGNGALTLVYEHRGKVENFTGVIKPPVQVLDKNGNRVSDQVRVKVGNRITAYYIKEGLKYNMRQEDGKRHDEVANANLIFQIKLLDPQKH